MNTSGAIAIPLRFHQARDFSEGLAAVEFGDGKDQWGYIDHAGSEVLMARFGDAGFFKEGLAPVEVHFDYGYIDKQGTMVIAPQFEHACSFSEGLACVMTKAKHKHGFIDRSANLVIETKYDMEFDFENGLAMVCRAGTWHYNEMTPTNFDGEWGYVNKAGSEIWDVSN